MPSKNTRTVPISIPLGNVKDAIIAIMDPVWRTAGLLKKNEEVVDIEFTLDGIGSAIPSKLKIRKDKEVYLEVNYA